MPALGESPVTAADGAVLALDLGSPVASAAIARGGGCSPPRRGRAPPATTSSLARIGATPGATPRRRARELGGDRRATRTRQLHRPARRLRHGARALRRRRRAAPPESRRLEALALAAPPRTGALVAAVDALRGEWFVQRFDRGAGDASSRARRAAASPATRARGRARGLRRRRGFAARTPVGRPTRRARPTDALAAARARGAPGAGTGIAALLTRPLYLRAPATTPAPPR